MPEADIFEAPQGKTFHAEPLLQSVTEAFVGNGVLANGDATVTTDGATAMGIDVAAADDGIAFGADVYNPSAASFTLSDGPTTTTTVDGTDVDDSRVDLVYFDSSAASYAVTEGTADAYPVPPSVPDDALMLAVVLVPHEATDIGDANILNWQARPNAAVKSGGSAQGGAQEASFEQGLQVGVDDGDLTESSSPASFTFTAGDGRDVHEQADVTISNSSGASATEDVTVELYDGNDTNGTLLQSETKSVSLNDGASTTTTFIDADENLDGGDYHINITTSASDLSIDETTLRVVGLIYSYVEQDDGTHELINRFTGTAIFSVDPITDEIAFPNAAIDQAEIADGSITTSKLANNAATAAKIAADAVTNTQIANDAVDETNIAALSAGIASVTNPGVFGHLFDVPVDSNATGGDEQSYTFDIGGNTVFKVYGEANGSGGVQNLEVRAFSPVNVNGNDITDSGTVVYSTTDGHVPRPQVDDERVTSGPVTSNTTTSGEEVVLVDTSGGAVTITLASADANDGNVVGVIDVAGSAGTNTITIDTEGSETIDGSSLVELTSNYGAKKFTSDGTDWFTSGGGSGAEITIQDDGNAVLSAVETFDFQGGLSATNPTGDEVEVDYEHTEVFEGRESGSVSDTNQGVLIIDHLADGETVEVYKAALVNADGSAVATGVDLELVTMDNAGSFTSRSTLIQGDGSTVFDDETGSPLATYTNSSGGGQTIAVLVDNGSGSSVSILASVEGVTGA